jgi:ABC-type polysaccharide/polyol phosphate export permease
VAIVLINYFIGIAFPYRELPDLLRPMVHVNPVCIGNNMIAVLTVGEEFMGYNPFNLMDASVMLLLAVMVFIIGLYIYSRNCWRR